MFATDTGELLLDEARLTSADRRISLRLLVFVVALSSNSSPSLGFDLPTEQPPSLLSETGLYVAGSTHQVDPRNLAFSPQYPLWSDDAVKSRWVYLPDSGVIDATDVDSWVFPLGTKFWKQFAFDGRRTETRLLWLGNDGQWRFAAYQWREDDSDAELAPEVGVLNCQPIAEKKFHSIPGIGQCRACHAAGGNGILGFNAVQLSPDRDPLAPHAEPLFPGMATLPILIEAGRLINFPEHLLDPPPRIKTSSSLTRAVLGYLAANCGGCHNSSGPLRHLGLDLRQAFEVREPAEEGALLTRLQDAADWAIPNAPSGATRWIVPGEPELSSVIYRMSSRRPSSQMPPLGTTLVDRAALELVKKWVVHELKDGGPPEDPRQSKGVY